VEIRPESDHRRILLDLKLTELALYAKELCPEATVETSTLQYEDEDGHLDVFPPSTLSEAEEERVELALAERAAEIFTATGLYILCAVLDPTARASLRSPSLIYRRNADSRAPTPWMKSLMPILARCLPTGGYHVPELRRSSCLTSVPDTHHRPLTGEDELSDTRHLVPRLPPSAGSRQGTGLVYCPSRFPELASGSVDLAIPAFGRAPKMVS
jgi:hypothetical protein